MTRLLRALALAALILLSFDARLAGVRADDVADCLKERGNTQIRGCSRIIKSGHLFGKPISKKSLAVAYNYRGLAYFNKGLHDSAIADYGKAIKLDPKDAKTYYNRGRVYDDKGQYDRAIADYDSAIRFRPDYAKAYNNLAWILATASTSSIRNGSRAVELASRAVALRDVGDNRETLAAAYAEAGRFGDAVREQERAIAKARDEGKSDLTGWQDRLRLYRNGRAYRQQ